MTKISDLLAEAASAGVVVRWKDSGKLGISGGTAELRQAIGIRKDELAACPKCQAVIPVGEVHCVPPASAEVIEQSRKSREVPVWGTPSWPDGFQPCHWCGEPAPYRYPAPSWCPQCSNLPVRVCESCSRPQHGVAGSVQECAWGECGSTRMVDRCEVCGKDAVPLSVRCIEHQQEPV